MDEDLAGGCVEAVELLNALLHVDVVLHFYAVLLVAVKDGVFNLLWGYHYGT